LPCFGRVALIFDICICAGIHQIKIAWVTTLCNALKIQKEIHRIAADGRIEIAD